MVKKTNFHCSDRLFSKIHQRFVLSQHIAAYKHQHKLPVKVPSVELGIITELKSEAAKLLLDGPSVENFIILLMKISITLQEDLIQSWESKSNATNMIQNLEETLRPQIKTLTIEILRDIKSARHELKKENKAQLEAVMARNIKIERLSSQNKELILHELLTIKDL